MINTELVLPFAGLDLLPLSLSIDSVTGEINGTPAELGTFDFTITVTDSHTPSNQASKVFNLEVVDPGPTDGYLIGRRTMDDNAQNTIVKGRSVYGNDGTAQRNTADMHITGVIAGALSFDGSTDYVDLSGLGSTLKEVNISVSVWARSDSVTGPINWILGNAKQFRFGFGHGQVYFWIQEEGLGSTNLISGGSISAGNWYHIVDTYDGTYQKLYVNSSLAASEAPGLGVLDNGHDNFTIGKACKSSSGFFDGDIDDVKIFSKALSASEVLALYDELELGQADLLPQYDTGASQQDNLTKLDNGPNDKNFPVGQISASSSLSDIVNITIITDGSTDLPDGQHQITAAQSLDGETPENSQPLTIEIDITQPRMIYRTPTREQIAVVDYMGFRFNEIFDSQTLNKTDIDLRTPNDDPVAVDFAVPMWDGLRSFAAFFDRQVLASDYAVTAGNIADSACNVMGSYNRDPAFSTLPDLSWVDIDLRIDFSDVIALGRTDKITNTNVCSDFTINYRIQDLVGQTL